MTYRKAKNFAFSLRRIECCRLQRWRDYDITDSNDGGQKNNRLLHSTRHAGTESAPVAEERWYTYGASGQTTRLIRRFGTGETVNDRAYWFYYDKGVRLWVSVSGDGSYHEDAQGNWVFTGPWNETTQSYDPIIRVAAAEYRSNTGRQRFIRSP